MKMKKTTGKSLCSDSISPIVTGKCTNNITEGYERAQPIPECLVADVIAPCTID